MATTKYVTLDQALEAAADPHAQKILRENAVEIDAGQPAEIMRTYLAQLHKDAHSAGHYTFANEIDAIITRADNALAKAAP